MDTADTFPDYDGPLRLSEAGLYGDLPSEQLVPGAIAVEPNFPLWSDGAAKRRWIVLPPGTAVDTTDPDRWVWPVGTKAFKEFSVGGRRIETRMIEKRDWDWSFVSFVWRADGSDADAAPDGLADASGTSHDVPSREDCAFCHDGGGDWFLGADAFQLDAPAQAALPLTAPIVATPPGDAPTATALGLLHGNCASCHRPGAPRATRSGLELDLRVGLTDPLAAPAVLTGVGKRAEHPIAGTTVVITPGDPAASQLAVRMGLRDRHAMPPIGTEAVDVVGLAAVEAWIRSLPPQ